MSFCAKCGSELEEGTGFCPNCGNATTGDAASSPVVNAQPVYAQPVVDPADFTATFDAEDISKNKIFGLCSYLLGFVGIIISLLAAKDSPFAMFHVRESLKLTVAGTLVEIITVVLCWTLVVPLVAVVVALILAIVNLVCAYRCAKGQAKLAPIVGKFGMFQ